ncbi:uncharacterized protein ATNIH1004_002044 [Aspergillus tanneri]|uniref:Major facilitator superfamily (MFS) profile domain-containing protein n=1 Tax=Aspergillus tanneri TaxID=1220188 RepID=A0A5M9M7K4_9EURO|nr:uncharacterized protein ATNIH1004_002044 [Aspergillus tanneri]KAA8641304.1 hypothetical protein ATNIH1004_002044 [Aspergillus tanneri]
MRAPSRAHDLPEHLKFRTKLRLAAILVAIYLVLFVAAFDQTIIATSIPTISASLHSASGYTWIGGAYLLANTAAGPLWAKCSDIWGRKLALLSGVAIFAAASIIAAMSTSMAMLITARALQGTAAGGPRPDGDDYNLGRLQYAQPSIVSRLTRRDVGSRRVDWTTNWGCIHTLSDGVKAVDWFGTFSIFGVTLLLLGLDFGGAIFPWNSPKVICLIVVGTLMIAFFLFSEKRLAKYPLMLLGLFKNWSNNAAFLAASAHSMVSMGVKYYLPLYFQKATMDIIVGILIRQTGRYKGDHLGWTSIIGFQIASGIGIAFLFQLPMIAVQNTVSQADTATATATLGVSEPVRQALSGRQAAARVDIGKTIQDPVQRHAVQDAFVWSIRNMLIMYTCIAGIAMIASAFMKQLKLRTEYTETKTGAQQLTK